MGVSALEVVHCDRARLKLPLGAEGTILHSFSSPGRVTINFRESLRRLWGLTSELGESMLWTKSNRDQYSLAIELKQAVTYSFFSSDFFNQVLIALIVLEGDFECTFTFEQQQVQAFNFSKRV